MREAVEVMARLRQVLADADADHAEEVSDAATTGERPDLWTREAEVLVEDIRFVLAMLAAAQVEG